MSNQVNLTSLQRKSINIDELLLEDTLVVRKSIKNNNSNQEMVVDNDLNSVFRNIDLLEIPPQIFNPHRILILLALKRFRELDFSSLRELAGIKNDGNLANHVRVLEDINLIDVGKEFVERRPKTFYNLTNDGNIQVEKLTKYLDDLLNTGDAK